MWLAIIENGVAKKQPGVSPEWSESYDVAVVGLGTAGAEAFTTLVQDGVRVFGFDRASGMGGQGTMGCICFYGNVPKRLFEYERAGEKGDVAYETTMAGVWTEGARIAGVRILTNGRFRDIQAKMVIDATGNATVARFMGLPLRKGREHDGVMAPCARAEMWLNKNGKTYPIYRNFPFDLTKSAREYSASVSKLAEARHAFWKMHRKNEQMVGVATMPGAREESRVVTEEIITLADALKERKFKNPIFHAWEPEDLPVFYNDHAYESDEVQNWKVLCGLPLFGYPSTLTYGTLVAKGVQNLFVPSKHFGVAHDLGGGIRMQGEMRKTGFVAAKAAEIAIRENCAARLVPYEKLEPVLKKSGMLNPPRKTYVTSYHGYEFKPYADDDVLENLKQDIVRTKEWWYAKSENEPCERAAYALWTCWQRRLTGTAAQQKRLADRLSAELSKRDRYAGNYAIALGLMEDPRAIKTLRLLISQPGGDCDPVVNGAYPNRIKAILLLGRFADAKSIPVLMDVLRDEAREFSRDLIPARAFNSPDMCRFQVLSYAACALKRIFKRHPNKKLENEMADIKDFSYLRR